MKTVWAIYTQFDPWHKYEESLDSLWSSREKALEAASSDGYRAYDHVWISEIELDSGTLHKLELETVDVKGARRE